jgi:hypothetical protein
MVVDVLTRMLMKVISSNLISGLCPDLYPGGVISLQYADDTILFLDNDVEKAKNLKKTLVCFEQVSGIRINYNKSELTPINMDQAEAQPFVDVFSYNSGVFPNKYLGIPLHYEKLSRDDIQPLIDKILKQIAGWSGKLLSYRGRIILIKTCLASISIYLLSFFKFPKWALDLINTQMANCLWNDFKGHRKLYLANWQLVCLNKDFGGLGIPNLRDLNMCLLGSRVKRYAHGDNKLWAGIVDRKYNANSPNIFCSDAVGSSTFWKGVMWAARAVKFGYRWSLGDGNKIRFWEDCWFGTSPLSIQFWDMYILM